MEGDVIAVPMHDGSTVRLRKIATEYDPTDRDVAYQYVRERQVAGEVVTGILDIDQATPDMHELGKTVDKPLAFLEHEELCPGSAALDELMERFR